MIGTTNTGINDTIFFEYGDIYSEKVKDFDAEVSGIVKSGNAANFRERVIREDVVIKSSWQFKSLLHHAVTCEGENKIEMISAVLQSSMENINHQDEDDNTPLMYLLYEAQEKGKYTKEDLEKIIRFLVERGASVEMRNNEGTTADDLITVLISKKILDDGIDKIIDEAKKSSSLPNQIKEQLSKHITNNGNSIIQEVAVYGNYAQIKLNSDGTELKISEFLQGDFCKDNGISGFSTFHNDDKGGMHGFLSPNGVRNYTVTDGSYDMTLDWVVGGKKCTITINISKDGVVVIDENGVIVEDKNGLTDEQLKANEYVTINGVSLFDAINKGRNREQNIKQENIHETNKVVPQSKEQLRRREAPLQRNVQQQKFATNKRDDLQYQNVPDSKGKTNPEVAGWFRGDTGLGVVSAPTNVDDSMTIRLLSESKFQAKVNPKKASTPKRTEQSDPQDTSSESIDGGKNTPEFIEYEQYYNNLMANSRNRDDLQNTSPKLTEQSDSRNTDPKSLGQSAKSPYSWVYGQSGSSSTSIESDSASYISDDSVDGFLGSFGRNGGKKSAQLSASTETELDVYSSSTDNKGIGDQSTLQRFNRELQDTFAKPNMGLKSPGAGNSQTEQSDSGFSSPTGNKGIGDQGTLQESESELKRRFAQPNMGLKSPGTSNSQTEQSDPQDTSSQSIGGGKNTPEFIEYEQYYNNLMANSRNRDDLQNTSPKSLDWPDGNTESDSGLGSSYSNLTTFDPKELEASLLLLKQKQGEQLFDRMLAQMKNKDVDIYKWMEEKREEAASGNGLEDQSGCKLDQKELPTSQQSTEKDSSILNSSEDERGLKPVDRNKMTKQTLEYLYGADVHDEPKHAEEVRTEPTCNHDKTRVRQANKQEGPHASRVRANSSQGKGVHSR